MSTLRLRPTGFLAIWLTAAALGAPQQPAASDVEAILSQAREEIRNFW